MYYSPHAEKAAPDAYETAAQYRAGFVAGFSAAFDYEPANKDDAVAYYNTLADALQRAQNRLGGHK